MCLRLYSAALSVCAMLAAPPCPYLINLASLAIECLGMSHDFEACNILYNRVASGRVPHHELIAVLYGFRCDPLRFFVMYK